MSERQGWKATIRDTPEARDLRIIFGEEVPVTAPVPEAGWLGSHGGNVECYMLDAKRISTEQRERLVLSMMMRFQLERHFVERLLDDPEEGGVPIRAELLSVPIPLRYFV